MFTHHNHVSGELHKVVPTEIRRANQRLSFDFGITTSATVYSVIVCISCVNRLALY